MSSHSSYIEGATAPPDKTSCIYYHLPPNYPQYSVALRQNLYIYILYYLCIHDDFRTVKVIVEVISMVPHSLYATRRKLHTELCAVGESIGSRKRGSGVEGFLQVVTEGLKVNHGLILNQPLNLNMHATYRL